MIDDREHARLADFGLSVLTDETLNPSTTGQHAGSVKWMAPELHDPHLVGFERFRRTKESDMYALGILYWEVGLNLFSLRTVVNGANSLLQIYAGKPPFEGIHPVTVVHNLMINNRRPERDFGKRSMSDALWNLVERCWAYQPKDRLTISVVVHDLNGMGFGSV